MLSSMLLNEASFNPRVLAGGRDRMSLNFCLIAICFNPRVLAGGRDLLQWLSDPANKVSIHASSREDATPFIILINTKSSFNPRVLAGGRDGCYPLIMDSESLVSIHASSREDATRSRILVSKLFCFNPRVLAGGRDSMRSERNISIKVSIHASSREDATSILPIPLNDSVFQSTRPRGRTRL